MVRLFKSAVCTYVACVVIDISISKDLHITNQAACSQTTYRFCALGSGFIDQNRKTMFCTSVVQPTMVQRSVCMIFNAEYLDTCSKLPATFALFAVLSIRYPHAQLSWAPPKNGKRIWSNLQKFPNVLCQHSSFRVEESHSSITGYDILHM